MSDNVVKGKWEDYYIQNLSEYSEHSDNYILNLDL